VKDFKNVEEGDSDFDYDTTENTTSENSEARFDIEQLRRELMQKIRPSYHEGKLKEALVNNYASDFEALGGRIRSMEEVVDNLFMLLNTKSGKDDLDGADDLMKESLNLVCRAENLQTFEKRQNLNTLLIKYEAFLKKLYYLLYKKDVPVPPKEKDKGATLKNAIYAIKSLNRLQYSTDPAYKKYDEYLNILRNLRNTESHSSIEISDREIDAALRVVIDMYLFVTATNITNLEMAGYYPDVAEVICMNKVLEMDDLSMHIAAEPRG
jgi:type I restriction enzyme R subunit